MRNGTQDNAARLLYKTLAKMLNKEWNCLGQELEKSLEQAVKCLSNPGEDTTVESDVTRAEELLNDLGSSSNSPRRVTNHVYQ